MRSPSFLFYKSAAKSSRGPAPTQGVTDFLRGNDRMASLLPAVTRNIALQKDCASILPALFEICSVMHFDAGQLVLATPNAAIATKLKQQLPKLQDNLLKRGWQVSAIRIKVQLGKITEKQQPQKQLVLPQRAMSALADLKKALADTPDNGALKAAIGALLDRHRNQK